MFNVLEIDQFGKKKEKVCCPHCNSTVVIRNGTYPRNHPKKECLIRVQRYLCKSLECPWKTFSVLPYPLLPIIRHFCRTLLLCQYFFNKRNNSQAATARRLGVTRGIVKRLGSFCLWFFPWFNHEKEFADWGPDPKENPAALWPDFTRDFSQTFYPKRWSQALPTQFIHR
jgi:transposase-like protein